MPEQPPIMPPAPQPERNLEEMTLEELAEKIRELTEDLNNAARANQGSRELEGVLAEIMNKWSGSAE